MVAAPETFEIARREGNPITNAEVYRRLTADGLLNATDKSNLVRLVADGFDYESILFYSGIMEQLPQDNQTEGCREPKWLTATTYCG
jgi:hypothetical protein